MLNFTLILNDSAMSKDEKYQFLKFPIGNIEKDVSFYCDHSRRCAIELTIIASHFCKRMHVAQL